MADPVANPPQNASSPLSVNEFAGRIKAKYPEYAGLDNATLAQKVVAKYPEYKGKVALPDSTNPDNTGIVGPDQTAPKLPPPEGFWHSAGSVLGLTPEAAEAGHQQYLQKGAIKSSLENITPHPLDMIKSAAIATKNEFGKGLQEGKESSDALQRGDIPGFLAHQVGQLGYAGSTLLAPLFGENLSKAGEQIGKGNIRGGLGTTTGIIAPMVVADAIKPKAPPLAKVTTPTQEAAFNVLHPENAVARNSILPEVRNAAAQQGVTKVPKGRAGVELPQRVIQGSIDNHEAQVQAIKAPYRGATVDNSAVANAALSKITPEMRAAAAAGDSGVQRSISQIEAVADRAKNANTIDLTDQLRHSWNDELSSELSKSAASQDVSPAATQAKRAAASALRSNMYDRLADLSGRDDVRALAQREGALIEAKAGLTKTANQALMSKKNDLGPTPRITAAKKAFFSPSLGKRAIGGTIGGAVGGPPGAAVGAGIATIPDVIRAFINPEAKTPIGQYQNRVMRSLSNLGPATPDAPLYKPPIPTGLLGPGATPMPPSPLGGPPAHISGLLPQNVESMIELPEKSQSTLTNGRTIESPASNPGVIPGLVRDYINRPGTNGTSGHNSINGGSLEELNRGQTLKVSPKTGATGVHGGSIDVGNGEAVLRQRPDGTLEVANNNSGVADSEILKRFGANAAQTFGKPGRAPGTIELIHRSGEHGDVPVGRVGDYLSSGEYRLAPRR